MEIKQWKVDWYYFEFWILIIGVNTGTALTISGDDNQNNSHPNYIYSQLQPNESSKNDLPVGFSFNESLGIVSYENRTSILGTTNFFILFIHAFLPESAEVLKFKDTVLTSRDTGYEYGKVQKLNPRLFDLYQNYKNVTWNHEDYYTEQIPNIENHFIYWTMNYTNNVSHQTTDLVIRSQPIPENILVTEGWNIDSMLTYHFK